MHRQLAPALRADYDLRAAGYVENARVELIDRFAQHVAQMAATARRLAGEHLGEANQILFGQLPTHTRQAGFSCGFVGRPEFSSRKVAELRAKACSHRALRT